MVILGRLRQPALRRLETSIAQNQSLWEGQRSLAEMQVVQIGSTMFGPVGERWLVVQPRIGDRLHDLGQPRGRERGRHLRVDRRKPARERQQHVVLDQRERAQGAF